MKQKFVQIHKIRQEKIMNFLSLFAVCYDSRHNENYEYKVGGCYIRVAQFLYIFSSHERYQQDFAVHTKKSVKCWIMNNIEGG